MEFVIHGNTLIDCIMRETDEERVVIPFGVTRIEDSAFDNEYNYVIKEIIIPPSVTHIGSWAFCDCCNLKEIIVPSSVTSMGERPFVYCTNIKKVILPLGLMKFLPERNFFEGCYNIEKFDLV